MGLATQQLQSQLTQSYSQGLLNSPFADQFARGFPMASLGRLLQSGRIPPGMLMRPPGMPLMSRAGFANAQSALFGPSFASRRAARLSRFLAMQPFARQQMEMALGGRVMGMGPNGQMMVQRFMPGAVPNGCPSCLQSMFSGGPNGFMNAVAGGLANLLGSQANAMQSAQRQNSSCGGRRAQRRNSSCRPRRCGSNNASSNSCGNGAGNINGVLNDPALTVEDRVTLMIMMIMKKMDQDIERQARYINALQQQQQGGKGGGGKGGGGAPSIDVETMKLKRMIDKRSQMFDMLRQIIDKYNQTAKGIIDSIGRN